MISANSDTPSHTWWKHGVIYQIYPRSFMDSNADGIGDLQGIIDKLTYLQTLGVDAIWISPIYPSPMADFGYDVSDYTGIHPIFGDMETFDRLLEAAHSSGMRVILDYVPNHTSDEHPWFIEARQSKNNPRRDWYIWRDPSPGGGPPNNWESFFGGSAWTWDERTKQYYLHLFLEKQPDLNWRNPEVINAMHHVLHFWLKKGVDGFRMDVVTFLMKHPELPDNPSIPNDTFGVHLNQLHYYDINQPEIHQRLREFRQIFDSYPGERVTIGETWFMDPGELATYYGDDLDELNLPFNFILLKQPWRADAMKKVIESYYRALPPGASPNFVLGNHDIHRLATRYGYENHRSAGLLLLTLEGTPTIYNGDELGMCDVQIPPWRLQDPVALRKPDSDDGRDPERAPMPWTAGPNAGFCPANVQPWLPVSENYQEINVETQLTDPGSTLNFYTNLLALRRNNAALLYGDFSFVEPTPPDVLAFQRAYKGQTFVVILNFSDDTRSVDFSHLSTKAEMLLSTHEHVSDLVALKDLLLEANESILLTLT